MTTRAASRIDHAGAMTPAECGDLAEMNATLAKAARQLRPDRRDSACRSALVERVRNEFRDLPGLCVTPSQAARLFGLSEDVCVRVLDELTADAVVQKAGNRYWSLPIDSVEALFVNARERQYQ